MVVFTVACTVFTVACTAVCVLVVQVPEWHSKPNSASGKMATKVMEAKIDETLTCGVCCEIFKSPRLLPCLHTYCHECIVSFAKQTAACPVCRAPFTPTENFSGFPLNYIVNDLVEALRVKHTSAKEKIDCDHCDRPAVSHCASCSEFMCDICVSGQHSKSKKTASHVLKPASEGYHMAAPTTMMAAQCALHANEIIKFFCRDCKRALCAVCAILNHHAHTRCLLADVHTEITDQLRAAVGGSAELVGQLQAATTRVAATRDALRAHAVTAQQQLDRVMEEIIAEVRARFGELGAAVRGETKTQDAALGEQEAELRRIAGDVQQAQQLAARILEGRADLLVMAPQVLERLATFDPRTWRLQPVVSGEVVFVGGVTQARAVQAIREVGGVSGGWKAQDWTLQATTDGPLLSVTIVPSVAVAAAAAGDGDAAAAVPRPTSGELFCVVPVFGLGDIRGPAIVVAEGDGSYHGQCEVPTRLEISVRPLDQSKPWMEVSRSSVCRF